MVHPARHGVQDKRATVALKPREKVPAGQGSHTEPLSTSPLPGAQTAAVRWGMKELRGCVTGHRAKWMAGVYSVRDCVSEDGDHVCAAGARDGRFAVRRRPYTTVQQQVSWRLEALSEPGRFFSTIIEGRPPPPACSVAPGPPLTWAFGGAPAIVGLARQAGRAGGSGIGAVAAEGEEATLARLALCAAEAWLADICSSAQGMQGVEA